MTIVEKKCPCCGSALKDDAENSLTLKIEDLDLSVRIYTSLNRAGIHTVKQVTELTEEDLLSMKRLSTSNVVEVKDKLESLGLSLRGSDKNLSHTCLKCGTWIYDNWLYCCHCGEQNHLRVEE